MLRRAWTGRRPCERSYKRGARHNGEVSFTGQVLVSMLTIGRTILIVLEERLDRRWCLSWTGVSTFHS